MAAWMSKPACSVGEQGADTFVCGTAYFHAADRKDFAAKLTA